MATETVAGVAPALSSDAAAATATRGERVKHPAVFAALVGHVAVAAFSWGGYFFVRVQPALDHELALLGPPGEAPLWRVCHQKDRQVMGYCRAVVCGCLLFAFVRLLMCVKPIGRRVKAARSGALGPSQRCAALAVLHGPLAVFSSGSFCLWALEIAAPSVCDDDELHTAVFLFALWGLLVSVACCMLVVLHARLGRPSVDRGSAPAALVGEITTVPFDRGLFGEGGGARYHAECTICLETFRPGSAIKVLRCGHAFHKDCLERWLQRKPTCALCRQEVAVAPAGGAFEAVVPAGASAAEGAPDAAAAAPRGAARPRPALIGAGWVRVVAIPPAHEARAGRVTLP